MYILKKYNSLYIFENWNYLNLKITLPTSLNPFNSPLCHSVHNTVSHLNDTWMFVLVFVKLTFAVRCSGVRICQEYKTNTSTTEAGAVGISVVLSACLLKVLSFKLFSLVFWFWCWILMYTITKSLNCNNHNSKKEFQMSFSFGLLIFYNIPVNYF